jgi:predicted Zn-ribbon and HTH transcriptional regulator
MFRRTYIDVLRSHPRSVSELAELLDTPPKTVADDLQHLLRSLKHRPERAVITPARCRQCGFVFRGDKLRKPGKCPRCKGTWISEPLIAIEEVL